MIYTLDHIKEMVSNKFGIEKTEIHIKPIEFSYYSGSAPAQLHQENFQTTNEADIKHNLLYFGTISGYIGIHIARIRIKSTSVSVHTISNSHTNLNILFSHLAATTGAQGFQFVGYKIELPEPINR
jgi:hypothetical protein